jgi:hypothetical protein
MLMALYKLFAVAQLLRSQEAKTSASAGTQVDSPASMVCPDSAVKRP